MNRKLVLPLVLLGTLVVLFCLLLANKDLLSQSPLNKGLPVQNLSSITSDADGNLYMIVEARRKIIKVNNRGECRYLIEPTGSNKNKMYLYSELAADRKGNLYVCRTDLDSKGIYVVGENILRFSADGNQSRVLHQIKYSGNQRPLRAGNIKSLEVRNDSLYFNYLQPSRIYLYSINLQDYSRHQYIIAYLASDAYIADITGTTPGEIYYCTQRGQIFNINANGESKLLYPRPADFGLMGLSWASQTPDRTFPTQLKLKQGKLYFIDTFANEIRCLSISGLSSGKTIFSQANLGKDEVLSVIKDMVIGADGSLSVALRDRIYEIDTSGQLTDTINTVTQPSKSTQKRLFFWCLPWAILGLFIYLLRYLYIEIMQRRVSLIVKQIVVFTPVIIVGMVFLSWFTYLQFADREEKEVYRQLVVLTRTGLNRLDPIRLQNISSPQDYMNADYSFLRNLTIEAQIHRGSYGDDKLDEAGLYTAIYKLENDRLYAIVDYDNSVNMYRPITIAGEFQRVLDTKKMVTDKANDENGSWMFAMAPIFDAQGKIIGIYESGVDRSGFNQERMALFKNIAKKISLITLAIIAIFLLITYYQLLSIRQLRNSVAEIAQGNWDIAVTLDTGDEVADLGASVNDMADHIRSYIQEITDLSEAYYRFVPQQVLNLLGKSSIIDVQLGDQVREDMSIFSLNIHSFYQLSGTMSPEDNFNFIKSYLSWMGPVISSNDGLIDKYTGSGFLALFPDHADQALQAAIELRKRLVDYNAGRKRAGYVPIDIGVGIHKGPLMLGIIGEEKRMAGTVISDHVNVAAFLQSLTNKLACSIIVTEDFLKAMENSHRYEYRSLGRIQAEGRDEPLLLYDIFAGESEEIRDLKLESRELFEEGIQLFQNGYFYDARSKFIDVIKHNRADEIARIYFYRCEEFERDGSPEKWNGVLLV
ncbi:MAG: adenylate/guanylate cyclase domain-containing protein [Methylocystaceae bacterium]